MIFSQPYVAHGFLDIYKFVTTIQTINDIIKTYQSFYTPTFEKEAVPLFNETFNKIKEEPSYNITTIYKSVLTGNFEQVSFL